MPIKKGGGLKLCGVCLVVEAPHASSTAEDGSKLRKIGRRRDGRARVSALTAGPKGAGPAPSSSDWDRLVPPEDIGTRASSWRGEGDLPSFAPPATHARACIARGRCQSDEGNVCVGALRTRRASHRPPDPGASDKVGCQSRRRELHRVAAVLERGKVSVDRLLLVHLATAPAPRRPSTRATTASTPHASAAVGGIVPWRRGSPRAAASPYLAAKGRHGLAVACEVDGRGRPWPRGGVTSSGAARGDRNLIVNEATPAAVWARANGMECLANLGLVAGVTAHDTQLGWWHRDQGQPCGQAARGECSPQTSPPPLCAGVLSGHGPWPCAN